MHDEASPEQTPTLVVRGRLLGWLLPSFLAASALGAIALASLVALSDLELPWMFHDPNGFLARCPPIVQGSFVAFVFGGVFALARSSFLKRAGRVELSERGVTYSRRRIFPKTVPWSELAAYSDVHATWIDVLLHGQTFPRPSLAIPTLDDTARAGALSLFDAHGFRRLEATARGRTLAHTLATSLASGTTLGLLFFLLVYAGNTRLRQLHALRAGTLPPKEADAIVERWMSIRHGVRPEIGDADALFIETRPELTVPAFFAAKETVWLETETSVQLDGRPVDVTSSSPETHPYARFCYEAGGIWGFLRIMFRPEFSLGYRVDERQHRLSAGRHELVIVTRAMLYQGTYVKETRTKIDVVPGSIAASTVTLVPGALPALSVRLLPLSGEYYPLVRYVHSPRAVATSVEILEGRKTLATGTFIAPAHESGHRYVACPALKLSKGHHVVTFRFTPDARVAFENDAALTQIMGEPFEREVVVDVP